MEYSQEIQDERCQIEKAAKLHWFHWLVVGLSLVITITAWYISKESIEQKIKTQFEREAKHTVELIAERMAQYEVALWGGTATIHALGDDLNFSAWRVFGEALEIESKNPGINGIGVIEFVEGSRLNNYLAKQHAERPDFHIHPQHNRSDFWPISYIVPVAPNLKAVGLDMAHEDNRYLAGLKARDTGLAQITAPITLVQDAEKTPGFLFYAPYYSGKTPQTVEERQKQFKGMVYAPFIFQKLMEGTLHTEKRRVGLLISDGTNVLYDEHNDDFSDFDSAPLFTQAFELNVYGRTWLIDVRSSHSFRNGFNSNQPVIILLGGLLIDILLLSLFILIANANQRSLVFIKKIMEGGR